MLALTKVLAGTAVAAAAVLAATPTAAQYYPYGNGPAPTMGNAPGYGYGYGGYGGYGGNQGPMVSQCTAAVQARLSGNGGGYGYANGGRVLGISRVDPRDGGGFTVRGVAASGGGNYGNQQPDLVFRCRTDFRGMVTDVNIQPAQRTYNSYRATPTPYGNGSPYNRGPYGQAPYNPGPYNQGQYNQGPYNQGTYDQGPYQQDPNDQAPDNSGPYGYSRY